MYLKNWYLNTMSNNKNEGIGADLISSTMAAYLVCNPEVLEVDPKKHVLITLDEKNFPGIKKSILLDGHNCLFRSMPYSNGVPEVDFLNSISKKFKYPYWSVITEHDRTMIWIPVDNSGIEWLREHIDDKTTDRYTIPSEIWKSGVGIRVELFLTHCRRRYPLNKKEGKS